MEGGVKIEGLEAAMRSLDAAFPDNPKAQAQLINGAMGGSARKSMLPIAKQLAKHADSSGALSEALAVRAQKASRRRGKAGGMEITPVRYNKKALALYIKHYYTNKGKNMPLGGLDGIRHGHLVEFGHNVVRGGRVVGHVQASPFLWPAARSGSPDYRRRFAEELKKRIESRVKREARKKAKR